MKNGLGFCVLDSEWIDESISLKMMLIFSFNIFSGINNNAPKVSKSNFINPTFCLDSILNWLFSFILVSFTEKKNVESRDRIYFYRRLNKLLYDFHGIDCFILIVNFKMCIKNYLGYPTIINLQIQIERYVFKLLVKNIPICQTK